MTIKVAERQYNVLKLIVHGFANRQMASILNVSPRAVEKDRAFLIRKFNVHNSTELVAITLVYGFVNYEPERFNLLWKIIDPKTKNDTFGVV